jgi:hypothetical protein
MANLYDRLMKIDMPILSHVFARRIGVDLSHIEILKDKLHVTLEREADSCCIVIHKKRKDNFVFHLEIQSENYYKIRRGALYSAILADKNNMPVCPLVVYIGNAPCSITTELIEPNMRFKFHLISLRDIPYRDFLEGETPEEMIFAILGDLQGENAVTVVESILSKIQGFEADRVKKCAIHLQILSNLRKLQPLVTKFIKRMPLTIDISEDKFLNEICDAFEARGEARGEAKGRAEGKIEGKAEAAKGMLESGRFSVEEIADLLKVSFESVNTIKKQIAKDTKKSKSTKK